MRISLLLIAIAAFAATLASAADKPASVSGLVKFEDGKPAAGVFLLVDGFQINTMSGKDGKFILKGIPWGLHTIVALLRGYKTAKRMNLDLKRGMHMDKVDFVLEKDPNYVPDALKLDELSPLPESILPPNTDVEFRGTVRYRLRNFKNARVVIAFEDDKKNSLVGYQSRHDITQGSASFPFRRTVRTPARFGNADIYLSAALIPIDQGPIEASDIVTYQVRSFNDDLKFGSIALSRAESRADSVLVSVTIDYALDTVARGIVRLRVLGDEGQNDFTQILHESSKPIDKAQAKTGSLNYDATFAAPARVKQLKLRVDLVPAESKDPKLVKWSKSFPTPADKK